MHNIDKYKNIIYFTYGTIGELLMTINLLEEIHNSKKNICIYILTTKNLNLYMEILSPYPYIKVYNARAIKSYLYLFIEKNIVIRQQTSSLPSKSILILCKSLTLLRAGLVIAFYEGSKSLLSKYSTSVYLNFDTSISFYSNLCALASILGVRISTNKLNIRFTQSNNSLLKPYIIIQPFCGTVVKTMPISRWIEIIEYIKGKWPQINIYATGSIEDNTKGLVLRDYGVICIFGQPSFSELAQMIKDSYLYIGGDTGVTHLASLISNKVILLGHNSYPTWLPTYNSNVKILTSKNNCICYGNKTGDCLKMVDGELRYRCLVDIDNSLIFSAIDSTLS